MVQNLCQVCIKEELIQGPAWCLQNITTGYPIQMVAADIMGLLPSSKHGNHYILIASDYFTRWVKAYAILNQEATTVNSP